MLFFFSSGISNSSTVSLTSAGHGPASNAGAQLSDPLALGIRVLVLECITAYGNQTLWPGVGKSSSRKSTPTACCVGKRVPPLRAASALVPHPCGFQIFPSMLMKHAHAPECPWKFCAFRGVHLVRLQRPFPQRRRTGSCHGLWDESHPTQPEHLVQEKPGQKEGLFGHRPMGGAGWHHLLHSLGVHLLRFVFVSTGELNHHGLYLIVYATLEIRY